MVNEKVKEIEKVAPEFTKYIDLAAERLGGNALYVTDDFFAEKENLLKPGRGVFIADKFTDRGKWMDGWESRRKRVPGHDWCVIRLASSGIIHGFDIDTNFFLGNHPPHAIVEAALINEESKIKDWDKDVKWKTLLAKSDLDAGSHNYFECKDKNIYSHVRLNIFPDGGVARFRVYGEVSKQWDLISNNEIVDLAYALNGGKAIACNDMFFSSMDNLLMPGKGINMGDGWETKRNRNPGNFDWVIIRLGTTGIISDVMLDTEHFKGNYPDSFTLECCLSENDNEVVNDKVEWKTLLSEQKLSAHNEHKYKLSDSICASHVRLKIYPDGGVSRLRLLGKKFKC